MQYRKAILVGVVGAILGGILVGMSHAAVTDEPSSAPLTVPKSRVGDEVVYELSIRDFGSSQSEEIVGTYELHIRIERLAQTLDRWGGAHESAVASVNVQNPNFTQAVFTEHAMEYIDVETRLVVRSDVQVNSADPAFAGEELYLAWFPLSVSGIPGLEFQGATLSLGSDASDFRVDAVSNVFARTGGAMVAGSLTGLGRQWQPSMQVYAEESVPVEALPGYEHDAHVEEQGTIGAADAVAVRSRVTAPVREILSPHTPLELWMLKARTGTLHVERTTWLTDSSPYPAFDTFRVTAVDDAGVERIIQERTFTRMAEQRGEKEIPWKSSATRVDRPNENVEAAHTPGAQTYPADGTRSQMPYPLSQALRDVAESPTMLPLALWRQQNPGAQLVSAQLVRGENHGIRPSHEWHLFFAVPSGQGYEVSAERIDGAAAPTLRDQGPVNVPPFSAADFAPNPVTIDSAEAMWGALAASKYQGLKPNYVHWGMPLDYRSTSACGEASFTIPAAARGQLGRLQVGYTSAGACHETSPLNQSAIVLDTRTGNLLGLYEIRSGSGQSLLPLAAEAEPAPSTTKTSTVLIRPPTPRISAAAATTFFAVFLIVYFWETLRWVAAKTAFLAPGYSKLRKPNLLEHRTRDALHQQIKENPGIPLGKLGQQMNIGWGTLVYHLAVLERNQLVSSLQDGRRRRYFPVGVVDWSRRSQIAVLANERTRMLYDLVLEDPGVVMSGLAHRAEMTLPQATWHLKRLETCRLLARRKEGRRVHFFPQDVVPRPVAPNEAVEVA